MPERLTLARHDHLPDHADWLARLGDVQMRDIYNSQAAELAVVRLPGGSPQAREKFIAEYTARSPGAWSHYPWQNVALRTLEPGALFELRTNLNRNLVTNAEQAVLRRAHVAIAGLSRVTDKRRYPPGAIEPPQLPLPQGIGVHYVADRQSLDYLADLHRQASSPRSAPPVNRCGRWASVTVRPTARRDPTWQKPPESPTAG